MLFCLIGVKLSRNSEIIAVRVKRVKPIDNQFIDLDCEQAKDLILRDAGCIDGLTVRDYRLETTYASKARYVIPANNMGKATILCKVVTDRGSNTGFMISYTDGRVRYASESELIAERLVFTNAKIVTKAANESGHISAIRGSFKVVNNSNGNMNKLRKGYASNDQRTSRNLDSCRGSEISGQCEAEERVRRPVDRRGERCSGRGSDGEKREQGLEHGGDSDSAVLDSLKEFGYQPRVASDVFSASITRAITDNPYGACLGAYSEDEYKEMNCIGFDNGRAGVAVKGSDLVSGFKHPDCDIKGFSKHMLVAGVLNGADKLDCYSINGALPSMYCKGGFIPVCRIKFDREFAPDDWNYARDGEPDIVFMRYCGDSAAEMSRKYGTYKRFAEYTEDEIPYITGDETDCAYDKAFKFRDDVLAESNMGFFQILFKRLYDIITK